MSDSPTIPDDDLGFDVISYAREIVSGPSHHDADEFSACARETLAAMLAAWNRLSERHNTLFRNHAFLMATKIPPTVISIPAPPADTAREDTVTAWARLAVSLLSRHESAWDHDPGPDDDGCDEDCRACEYVALLRTGRAALSAPAPAPTAPAMRRCEVKP